MRDILASTKGRTQSQKDYGRDAGDYVPLLEQRTVVQSTEPSVMRIGAYGRFGTLAQRQEAIAYWQTRRFGGSR